MAQDCRALPPHVGEHGAQQLLLGRDVGDRSSPANAGANDEEQGGVAVAQRIAGHLTSGHGLTHMSTFVAARVSGDAEGRGPLAQVALERRVRAERVRT